MGTYNGNKRDNTIIGSAKADFINGKEGNDQLWGRAGNDEIHGWYGVDYLYGEAGNDRLLGEYDNDFLYGGDGDDLLNGGAGNDELHGDAGTDDLYAGLGTDQIWGGSGADHFLWGDPSESDTSNGIDTIKDFNAAEGDVIWLTSTFDADSGLDGRQHWQLVDTVTATSAGSGDGQATVVYANGSTIVSLYNNDGDTNPEFVVQFAGEIASPQMYLSIDGTFSDAAIIYPGG